MHKKIKELWEQAAQRDDLMDEKRYEKFAELLIRDCAKQVNNVYKQGGGTYAEAILKHYNIEIK
jgi:NADPH-dependent curcumin reductase CurA